MIRFYIMHTYGTIIIIISQRTLFFPLNHNIISNSGQAISIAMENNFFPPSTFTMDAHVNKNMTNMKTQFLAIQIKI